MFDPDAFILNHVAQYHTTCRDYLTKMSPEHLTHINKFINQLMLMNENKWIKNETCELAIEIMENLKRMYKDGYKEECSLYA